jgi:hypothetical protein
VEHRDRRIASHYQVRSGSLIYEEKKTHGNPFQAQEQRKPKHEQAELAQSIR